MLDIHSSDTVIVGLVSALAAIQVLVRLTVFLMDSSALRATLRSVFCQDFQYFRAIFVSLIGQKLLKLIESPASQVAILFSGFGKICFLKADTR